MKATLTPMHGDACDPAATLAPEHDGGFASLGGRLMDQVRIQSAGWLMAVTTGGFLIVTLAEAIMRIVCHRK